MRIKRIVSWAVLAFLLIGNFALALRVKPAWAIGDTVYINNDGSVTPAAPISSSDNVTYTLTGNVSWPTYYGIVVKKSGIVIDGDGHTVQGNLSGNGLDLTSISNVTIKNINVRSFRIGINLSSSDNNMIIGNNVTANNSTGIYLYSSPNNMIIGNNLTSNTYGYGIILSSSNNNTVTGNKASTNDYGIVLSLSDNNTLNGNTVSANSPHHGIFFNSSNNNTISGNSVTSNHDYGIWITNSSISNTVSGNNIDSNPYGLDIRTLSNNNRVLGNNVTNSTNLGISFYQSSGHNVLGNNITGNNLTSNTIGIRLITSSNNVIYHNNFINNSAHASIDGSSLSNAWNGTYPSGGNYWGNYTGVDTRSGPYQDQPGSDGMGDTNHTINTNNRDYYPLMRPYVSFEGQTIYIRPNGTVDPSGAPVAREGDNYTLTDNVSSDSDGIVIQRNNMTLNGAGFTVQGSLVGYGLSLTSISNVTVQNLNVNSFLYGIFLNNAGNCTVKGNNASANVYGIRLDFSSNSTVIENTATGRGLIGGDASGILFRYSNNNRAIGNNLTANTEGLLLTESSNNTVSGNNMENNSRGLEFVYESCNNSVVGNSIKSNQIGLEIQFNDSSYNVIHHNNFINSSMLQVYLYETDNAVQFWNDTYPSGGNYWSNYTDEDAKSGPLQDQPGSDGMGDVPYVIDADNQDNYPLMKAFPWDQHDIGVTGLSTSKTVCGQGYPTNANIMIFNYGENTETLNVTAYANTTSIGSQNVTLTSANSATITLTWNTTGFAKGNYSISAYAWPVPGETDTTDNNLTGGWIAISMVGDLTGGTPNVWDFVPDGKCSSADVSVVARCFGSSPDTGPPMRWEPNCDLNNNGHVDGADVATVARHFGEADP